MYSNKKLKTNLYSQSDSGLAFILALLVPQILILIVVLICGLITGLPYSSSDESVKTFVNTYQFTSTLISALVPQISFLIVFIFISERRKVNYKTANQINFKLNIWVLMCVLAIGLIALFGFSPLINMLDSITSSWGYKSSVANIDVSTFWKFFGTVFYVALLPAICEELIFRGIITNGLKKFGTVTAVVLSAVFFSLMHQNLQQLVYQLFLGGVMAYIAIKTGSIIYTMLLHFFNNFVILFSSYLSGDSEEILDYSNAWNVIYPILLVIFAVAAILGLLWVINFILKKPKEKKQQASQSVNLSIQNENQSSLENITKETDIQIENINKDIDNQTQNSNNVFEAINTANEKFYQNQTIVIAIITGIIFWVFAVISAFK